MTARKRKPRSYSAGKRATSTEPSSAVRVYERTDLEGFFLSCAWDRTASGRPREMRLPDGISWEGAKALADLTAAKRRERILSGRTELGAPKRTTLEALCREYHRSSTADGWSKKHREDKERAREFWFLSLGRDQVVEELSPATVQRLAREARNRNTWGVRKERKLLAYIRAATRWGCDKARLYDAYPLRGLELPDYEPDTEDLIYSETETARILGGHPDADWRDVLAAHIAADTGRRISAILALRVSDIRTDDSEAQVVIRFGRESDKGGRTSLVPVSVETAQLLAEAVEQDIVSESGWLFPEGRLGYDDPRDKPRSKEAAIKGLHRLEQLVGVKRVRGKAYHGLKRAHVTIAMEESAGDTALVGDVTGNLSAELLRKVYRRQSQKRSRAHVERVRARFQGARKDDE